MTDTQRGGSGRGLEPHDKSQDTEDDGPGPRQRFHDWREGIRRRPHADRVYRIIVGVLGGTIVVGGLALVPLPGPGWLIVFLGLAILATEFEWAHRLNQYARKRVSEWTHWLGRQHLAVRILFGFLTALFVLAIVYTVLRVLGVPAWVPDDLVAAIPGLKP